MICFGIVLLCRGERDVKSIYFVFDLVIGCVMGLFFEIVVYSYIIVSVLDFI